MSLKRVELGDIFEVSSSKRVLKKDWQDTGVPFYRTREIVSLAKRGYAKGGVFISEELFEEYKAKYGVPNHGDILLSAIGSLGIAYAVKPEDKFYFKDASVLKLSPKNDVEISYILHALKTNDVLGQINSVSGSTVGTLTITRAKRIKIPLPPLPEQKRIAAILDQADAFRRQRQRALDQLNQLGQSIFYEMFGDPHSNPKGHDIVPVGNLAESIVPGRDKPKSFSGGVPWITTGELVHLERTKGVHAKKGLSETEIANVRARVIPSNSVIMTCVGDLGVVSIADEKMVINQQLHSFQCGEKLTPEYLMYALNSQKRYMIKMATSTTLPYMNKGICNGIPVQVPDIHTQEEFSRLIVEIEKRKTLFNTNIKFLETLFASLQHRAFRGKL